MESSAKIMDQFEDFNKLFVPENQRPRRHPSDDTFLFKSMTVFFDHLGQALKALEGHVKVELLFGDMVEELAKMRLKTNVLRPPEFPTSYIRMWLSNVPLVVQSSLHNLYPDAAILRSLGIILTGSSTLPSIFSRIWSWDPMLA